MVNPCGRQDFPRSRILGLLPERSAADLMHPPIEDTVE